MTRGLFRRLVSLVCAVPAVLIAGCESDSTTGPRIVSIEPVSGLGQSGLVGALLGQPFVVRAADQNDNPIEGALISWSITSGGGVISPSQSVTGPDGTATATMRLGSALGAQSARAVLGGADPVTFTATANAAPASQLSVVSGDNQTATVGATLVQAVRVKVADGFGNAVSGVTVIFAVTLGGGSLSSPTAISDASGFAQVTWTLGPAAGNQRVSATVTGVAPVTFNATAQAGAAASLVIVSGSGQSAAPGARLADSLVVRVTDQFGNAVRDATVAWTPVGDAGTVSPASGKTDVNGRAATAWTLGATGGPKEVRATAGGLAPVSFSAAGTIIFANVTAGGRHSCGLDEGGVAYCWGFNGDGQLGLGQPAGGSGPVFSNPEPTAVAGGLTFAGASGGGFHTCAMTLSFNPYCWGKNVDGRLGNAANEPANAPSHVSGVNVFNAMSAGGTHSCALTLGGRAFCWGSNAEGQIGVVLGGVLTSDSLSFNEPLAVLAGASFASIAAGGLHSCAIMTTGSAWCWGNNAQGQLGAGAVPGSTFPILVSGGNSYSMVVAGAGHSCGLTTAGTALCWGDNASGQLGDGTTSDQNVPVAVSGGLTFVMLSAGQNHTCGLTAAGLAFCWGGNAFGQLGNNTTSGSSTPVAVGGGLTFQSLGTGERHSCGVTTGRVAYCWGDNQFGQLGDGTQTARLVPTKVTFQP